MESDTKHILVIEDESKNIFKFKVGNMKNILIQQSGRLNKDRYWLNRTSNKIKFVNK